jgi:exosortase
MTTASTISLTPPIAKSHALALRVSWAAILCAAGVVALRGAWADMARFAIHDEESSQILMVPVVLAWLVWARRGRLARCRLEASWSGPLLVVAGWAVSHLGFNHSIQCFWHGGAVLVLLGCVASVLGFDVLLAMWPAVLAAAFLVPVPGTLRLPLAAKLQNATARTVEAIMSTFGANISRSSNQLIVNGHPVLIAEACNGMRLVFPLFLAIYVFVFITPLRAAVRWLLILTSPIAAVLCNVVRVIPTVWMYGHATPAAADRFHELSGWPMIVIAFLMLMGLIKLLEWAHVPVMAPSASATDPRRAR